MLTSQNIEITNNKNNIFNNETYILVKKMIPTNTNEETINLFNKIMNNIKLKSVKKKQKLIIGVIKFKDKEGIEYIHCPIVNVSSDNIVIGVCKHFDSVINNKEGKKQMASHKFQHHYKCNNNNNFIQIFLKTNECIENSLNKYEEKELKLKSKKRKLEI